MQLRVVVGALMLIAILGGASATLPTDRRVMLLKFFKVGGTTVAEVLGRLATRDSRRACCRGAAACDVCYTHDSLRAFGTVGASWAPDEIDDDGVFRIAVLRDPAEREFSRYWFERATGEHRDSLLLPFDRWVRRRRPTNEYVQTLAGAHVPPSRRVEVARDHLANAFTLVAPSHRIDHLLAALSLLWNESAAAMAQVPLKRVVGRPREMENSTRAVLDRHLAADRELYVFVRDELFDRQLTAAGLALADVVTRADEMAAVVAAAAAAGGCRTDAHHTAPGLHGVECYDVSTTNRPKFG